MSDLVFRGHPLKALISRVWMLDSEASCTEHGELPFFPSSSGGRQTKNLDAGSLQLKPGSPSSRLDRPQACIPALCAESGGVARKIRNIVR
eukprot:12192080-Alexandrium_andersonii.AAC.1